MKSSFLSIVLLLLSWSICAQTKDGGFSQMIEKQLPLSSQASDFLKFGTFQMDYSTGVPKIGIPLYEVKLGNYVLPISINYHASGIKVQDIASPVGLGWTLDAGGCIIREKRSACDYGYNNPKQFPYYTESILNDASNSGDPGIVWKLLADGVGGENTETDRYNYSFPGHSGVFRISLPDYGFYTLPYEPLSITCVNPKQEVRDGFKIVDELGNILFFTQQEESKDADDDLFEISCWYLTKIIPQGVNDSIILTYEGKTSDFERTDHWIPFRCEGMFKSDPKAAVAWGRGIEDYSKFSSSDVATRRLKNITWKGNVVQFNYKSDREDYMWQAGVKRRRLDNIIIKNGNNQIIKQIALTHYYSGKKDNDKRLMLKSVAMNAQGNNNSEHFQFEYEPETLPSYIRRSSYKGITQDCCCYEDYWGYYNGKKSNQWIPSDLVPKEFASPNRTTDRKPVERYCKAQTLKKIVFPTGGCTEFYYESNRLDDGQTLWGGLRLKQQISRNVDGIIACNKTYKYENACVAIPLTKDLYSYGVRFVYSYNVNHSAFTNWVVVANETYDNMVYLGTPVLSLNGNQGSPIHYMTVYEYDGDVRFFEKRTKYEYELQEPDIDYLLDSDCHSSDLPLHQWNRYYNYDVGPLKWSLVGLEVCNGKGETIYNEKNIYEKEILAPHRAGVRCKRRYIHIDLDGLSGEEKDNTWIVSSDVFFIPSICKLIAKTIESDGLIIKNTYSYDPSYRTLSPLKVMSNLGKETSVVNYVYANTLDDSVSKKMVEANMVGIPVATLYSRNGTVCAGQRTEYGVWGDKILPSYVSALNTDQTSTDITECKFDRVISYRNYDDYGNPQEVIYKGDTTTYLWGYKGQYPIAEIKGMDYNRVSGLLGKNLSGLLSKTNLSAADFEPLRNYVQGKPIALTTCLYKPLVGVTQITDPTNQTQSFQYDKAGRLAKSYFGTDELHNAYYYHYADQTDGRNYVLSTEYQDETASDSTYTIQYYDEWGRPSLSKTLGVNMHRVPVFSLQTYDKMGRPDKAWTPIPSGRELTPENFATNSSSVFNGDSWGFAETTYDGLGRTIRTTVPGKAWHDKGAATTYTYLANSANTVKLYKVEGDKLVQDGYYPAQSLSGTTTTDPDGLSVTVYKDVFDNVVLERRADDNDTYYVYDDYNRLRFVLQPMYQEEEDLDKFAFQYKYNGKGLMTEKKLPGCQPVAFEYDTVSDRLSKMQDGVLKINQKWRVYDYDVLGRLKKQSISNGTVVEYDEIENFYDNYDFVDKYGYMVPENTLNDKDANLYSIHPDYGQGQLTGVLQRASNGELMILSHTYDDHQRLMITKEIGLDKHLGVVAQWFNFNGTLSNAHNDFYRYDKKVGKRNDNSLYAWQKNLNCPKNNKLHQTNVIYLQYDPNQKQKSVMTHSYAYDEFGRIARSDRSGNAADMEYSYDDMHGWLTETESHGGFKQTLYHENADKNPRYNGSIAAMSWEVDESQKHTYHYKYDELNRLVAADYSLISYSKGIGSLDKTTLNKDIDAIKDVEKQKLIPRIDLQRYDYSVAYEYDRNCNIKELRRMGTTNSAKGQVIDNLDFGYSGNQLRNVTDDADVTLTYAGAFDFQDKADKGVEYSYNENGAMTQDLNKGIKNVEYDLLGYPRKVTFSEGDSIVYVYAADGRKLREVHCTSMKSFLPVNSVFGKDEGTSVKPIQGKDDLVLSGPIKLLNLKDTTDYVNAYVFKNNKPYMFNFQDGYYSFDDNGKYNGYHLYVKDYQGNIRLVVNGETDSIDQVNHYYPYGALMGDISTSQDFQKYKYSGKELDRQFGLDWYDFHARQQDPLLGRFNSVDPLAEETPHISLYAYCAGNPINLIDPSGMSWYRNDTTGYFTWFDDEDLEEHRREGYTYWGEKGALLGQLEARIDELFRAQWPEDKKGLGLYEDGTTVCIDNSTNSHLFDMFVWLDEFKSGNGPEIRILTNPNHQYSKQLAEDRNVKDVQAKVEKSGQETKEQSKQWMPWDHLVHGLSRPIMNFVGTFDFKVYPSGRTIACDRKSVYSYYYHIPGIQGLNHNRSSLRVYGNTYQFYVVK